jgi:chromosome segregation ATPase
MNYKAVTRNFQSENKKINYLNSAGVYNHFKHNSVNNSNTEQKTIDNSISAKEKQLKNIMSLIEILKKENENLKIKIENAKNTEQKFKLIDDKKDQEKQLINLNFDIKKKKMELKEHSRCPTIKAELLKKISMLKEEIVLAHEKLVEVQKKYDELENKNKLEQQGLFNSKGEKLNKFGNKTKTKFQKYVVPKQKPAKVIQEESIIDVPPKIGEIFTDKELNAMFNALDKNRTKYDALLKRFNVQNIYVDSLEARHKLDIKQKLDKINELDEQIEFMSIKKGEYNANIQIYKKQILAAQEEKKNYKTKIDAVLEEISKKNKINSRKDNEIKQLQAQLAKFKKYLKNGEFDKIHNEPEIEIKGDEDDTENEGSNEAPVESTAKTGFYDNKENNLNNIKVKNNNETNEEQEENDDNNPKDDDTDNNKEVIVGDAGTNTDALV